MFRRSIFCLILMAIASLSSFGQASAIRDYVGMISQTFHPDAVSYLEEFKRTFDKQGYSAAARSIDNYLKGDSGTGFMYVTSGGKNYILTNFHVISSAHTLSITFEKPDGEKTKYADLAIIAADEEMDIALLAFAGGQNPFRQGLAFLNRALQDGDAVFSAGFPGLGTNMIWQFGGGMVSNVSVRIPSGENNEKILGPFVQHTAQVDPGNSGGPLLVQVQGVPTGYAVAGINTLSARNRQAANYSIPLNRVQTFLDKSLRPAGDALAQLNDRIASFNEGLAAPKAVYTHIASYLSNACSGENAEYAIDEVWRKAPRTVRDEIVQAFVYSPVDGMTYAVAWTIEDALRSGGGKINIATSSVTPIDDNQYKVSFDVNNKTIDSVWVNEYGIWRIKSFGDFAAGDKTFAEKKKKERAASEKLITEPTALISLNFASIFDAPGKTFGGDLKASGSGSYFTMGLQAYFADDFKLIQFQFGFYYPITAGNSVAFLPFADAALGVMILPEYTRDSYRGTVTTENQPYAGVSVKGGLMITTSAVSGLYLQAAYQRNFFKNPFGSFDEGDGMPKYPNMIIIGLGYAF